MLVAYTIGLSFRNACRKCNEDYGNGCLGVDTKRFTPKGTFKQIPDWLFDLRFTMHIQWVVYQTEIRASLKRLHSEMRAN